MDRRTCMSLQNATPAVIAFARYFARPLCPECGHEQFVPERSAFVAEGRICHAWLCEEPPPSFPRGGPLGPPPRCPPKVFPKTAGPPPGAAPVRFCAWSTTD